MIRPYETYKDSGVEWIGKIPAHWNTVKFRYKFETTKGLIITKSNLQDSGIPCVNYGEIHSKYGFEVNPDIHYLKCVSEEYLKTNENSLLSRGDFVFADTSEDIKGAGNFTHLHSNTPTFAGYHTIIARLTDNSDYRYVAYLFDSIEFRTQIQNLVKGVKVYSITNRILKDTVLFNPLKKEQTQIATYLDHKTGLIERCIAQKEELITKLKEQRQAIINEAVTKGLNPNVPLKDSGIEWLGEIPEHWEVAKFKYFAKIKNGKDQKRVLTADGKYPVLGTGGEFGRASKFLYNKPSVLLGRKGTIDKPQFIETPFWTVDTLFYTEIFDTVVPKFLYFLSKIIPYDFLQESSAVPSMTQEKLHNVFLTKPIKEEQIEIVNYIENELVKMDGLLHKAKDSIQKLKEYRRSIISEAVTGKIDVRDWKPKTT